MQDLTPAIEMQRSNAKERKQLSFDKAVFQGSNGDDVTKAGMIQSAFTSGDIKLNFRKEGLVCEIRVLLAPQLPPD
jgi:hypothetical protein